MKKFVYTFAICCIIGLTACQNEAKNNTTNLSSPTNAMKKDKSPVPIGKVSKTLDIKGGNKVNFRGQQLAEKYCKCNKRKSNKEVCKAEVQHTFDKVHKRLPKKLQANFKKSFEDNSAKCK